MKSIKYVVKWGGGGKGFTFTLSQTRSSLKS